MLSHGRSTAPDTPVTWVAVVPVKPLPTAKTRLRGAVPEATHPDLVLAMARDTVAAALACGVVAGVVAVCDDRAVRAELARLGANCLPDAPAAGLNAAFAFGARGAAGPVAALTADLPALRPADLESALVAAVRAGGRAFVPDLEGTGTVLLTAPSGAALAPRFGPGSAAAHLRSGAAKLDGRWPSLRRDVDTAADLDAAARLGLGTHTGQVLCTVA
ncbi:2-phospho-L-lactate guanylyltransferase [Dactylosporangium roseum]|uniref:Phosphoenolpyruvate guanylyltransferase n=1 Tax=Dactylosporangium roseum TaxID=47989 RepID=A0ABY5Z7V2_9ACTN|nr:2-phospho-L-lactate guanylyltransferase [Dactylosporangium roseum]UWZ38155.1 2-phospho-L-lactate guanylyltransferase [Dactylosporangium roseum]